ncbi:MAG: hypothetical protein LLF94_03135 [Chlamydiales bacterium]|nr:hypothetical protein [Chlamydiales bacterium]
MRYLALLFLLLVSCSSKSPEYFLAQGQQVKRELLSELEGIDDIDTLLKASPRLQMLFNQLVEVMIEAKKWQNSHKTAAWQMSDDDSLLSQQIAQELSRIYEMPSAQSLIEKTQEIALLKLDSAVNRKKATKP